MLIDFIVITIFLPCAFQVTRRRLRIGKRMIFTVVMRTPSLIELEQVSICKLYRQNNYECFTYIFVKIDNYVIRYLWLIAFFYLGYVVEKKRHSRMKKMGKAKDEVETFETLVSSQLHHLP